MHQLALVVATIDYTKLVPVPKSYSLNDLHILPCGFIPINNANNQHRNIEIMDALASILVSQRSREGIALGAQLNYRMNTVTILIGDL